MGGWLEALTSASSDSYTDPPYGGSHEAVVWAQCSAYHSSSRSIALSLFAQHVSEGMCRVVSSPLTSKRGALT